MKANFGNYSNTWDSYLNMPEADRYLTGSYTITATSGYRAEGFDSPYYEGVADLDVVSGQHTEGQLTMSLVSSVSEISFDSSVTGYFQRVCAYLHSEGGGYLEYSSTDHGLMYLNPGKTYLTLHFTLPDGRKAGVHLFTVTAKSGCYYHYTLSLRMEGDTPVLTATHGEESRTISLTEEFLSALPPEVKSLGWTPGLPLVLPEGDRPSTPVKAVVSSASDLQYLYVSINSPSLAAQGVPMQINLLSLSPEQEQEIRSMGLEWSGSLREMTVDFTNLLGKLTYISPAHLKSVFGISPVDIFDRVGEPKMLVVETSRVAVSIAAADKVTVGAKEASVVIACDAADFGENVEVELTDYDGDFLKVPLTAVESVGEGRFRVSFEIPEGSAPIEGRLLYCGKPAVSFTLERKMPLFDLEVDPFTTFALIKITAADDATASLVASMLYPYIDGEQMKVLSRDPERGIVIVSGLSGGKSYTLKSTMMARPTLEDFTPEIRFTTEEAIPLPNSDFENRRPGPKYASLPSGGRYSQTVVAIFNWQNHQNFDMEIPAGWANTNSKTFNSASAVHNTWYMLPGVYIVKGDTYSGNFSVCLRSVGYDPHGQEIPDYTQTSEPYLNYSPIVPHIRYRAAARLFLGAYSFDVASMQERYDDIVAWKSRPMSLNGYYKYTPSADTPSDAGLALVEVYGLVGGERTLIGSGRTSLSQSNSFAPFSAQIDYYYFGVKATGIRVMFASSGQIGDIAEESARVPVTFDLPSSSAIGSLLTLDHVHLTY